MPPPVTAAQRQSPKSCPEEGGGDGLPLAGIARSQKNWLFSPSLPVCMGGKRGGGGLAGPDSFAGKAPSTSGTFPTHRDRESPASHPGTQPGTGSLHDTTKTLMVGNLLLVVEVLTCLRKKVTCSGRARGSGETPTGVTQAALRGSINRTRVS